jgi:hypothetical protein
MIFRRPTLPEGRRASRIGVLVLAVAGLVLGLLSVGPTASASTAKTPASTRIAKTRTAAKATPAVPAAKAVKTHQQCATPTKKGVMSCFALRRTDVVQPAALQAAAITPNATPSGYGPTDLDSAYKLSSSGGSGATVAIVDAYNDPNIAADLTTYRAQYGLPACTTASGCFKVVNQTGATSPLPTNDSGWAGEETLDVDMVSAVCPNCKIVLVEASSASDSALYTAEDTAAGLGKYVSNSWGGAESSTQTSDDTHFNHPGVAITVSSGDEDYGAEYPATSKYVTAVGGTHLTTSSTTRGWTETVWKTSTTEGTGSGCSAYDTKPTWQTVSTGSCTKRAEADVSAVADPATGVAVYETYGASGWTVYGGTSAAAPIIAGVYALAGTPASGTYPASYPYSHTSNLFDVTSGNNGTCGAPICTAGTGWDGPTGLGTPNGTTAFTSGTTTGGNTVTVTNPGSKTATVGTAFSLTVSASDSASGQTLSYSASGLPTGLSINSSTGVISGTPTAGGTFSTTVTATDTTGASGSATFTITVSGGTGGGCTSAQLLGNPGFESGTTPWTASTGVVSANGSGETAHAGTHFAWMDGYGTTHTDTLSQSVTVPAACAHSTLTFYLHIDTAETTTTTAYDKLTVTATPSGGSATTIGSFSNLNKNTGYTLVTESLAAYAGKTVTIKFSGVEDTSLQTSFVVDDTAVTTAS